MALASICRQALAVLLLIGIALCASGQALDLRCMQVGGDAFCRDPIPLPLTPTSPVDTEMWTYNVCDMDGSFPWRATAWCTARGGCSKPVFDTTLVGVSAEFERIVNNACQVSVVDSGWGQTLPSNILCWTGPPLWKNQLLIRDFRILNFNGFSPTPTGCNAAWKDTVFAGRWRNAGCPLGFGQRTAASGDLECWTFIPTCVKTGNPINLLDGCKLQRELDYRSRAPGGIEVERYYNSTGFIRFDARADKASDYWRTTWDRRIVAPPIAGSVLAYGQRADGSLLVFLANGREKLNMAGGGSAQIERLVDGAGGTAGWRLMTSDTDIELYDASGRLKSVTLRSGWTYALGYDSDGRLATVTDTAGNVVTFTYDAAGRVSGFVAPGNRMYTYGYDTIGRFTSVTYPDNAVRTYHYENATFPHALTGITDENGVRFSTWTYDSAGRATSSQHAGGAERVNLYYGSYSTTANEGSTSVVDAFGTTRYYYYQGAGGAVRVKRVSQPCPGCNGTNTIYTFDANGNVASVTDFNGIKTTYVFDLVRNLEIARTEAAGTALARTTTMQWHPVHRLPTRITAPSGVAGIDEVTDFGYDAQGNLLQKTFTAGARARQWTTVYNGRGQPLTVDGPRVDVADVTTYTYYDMTDACIGCRGNLRTITNALGHVTTFNDYDVDGQPARTTDANGVATTSAYDVRRRLRTRTVNAGNPDAETTTFGYDGVGQLTSVATWDGTVLRYQYDDAHRLTEIADNQGGVIQYTLDAMGNRIREDVFDSADRLVRSQQRIYDALVRLNSDIGAAGQTSAYRYDGNGNLTARVDPLARTTTLGYDALNRLLTSTDPAGGVTRYGYDAKDRLASVRDPINLTTTYTYDGLGNLTQIASPDTGISTFVPDAQGNVVGSTDARGLATSYTYDALNRQILASHVGGSVALEYDNTGSGGDYARGRLTKVTDPSGTTNYAYDARGRVVRKTQTVGSDASAKTFIIGYQYAAGRATGIAYPSGRSASYSFDAQGRIAGITIAGQNVLTGAVYLPFGGVTAWTWGNGQTYRRDYDADGRIATVTSGPNTAAYGSETWTFGYDVLNRLTAAVLPQGGSFTYAYDGDGNRKQENRGGAATNYGYNATSNRLQALSGATVRNFSYDATGNLIGNGSMTFTYDGRGRLSHTSSGYRYSINGLGQRVAKSGPAVATGTLYFVYDEQGHLIGEYDAAGAVRQEIVYLGDTPVASIRPSGSGGTDIYPIYSDHLDTPRLITNQANQKMWEWKTDTFGVQAANEDPSGLGVFTFNSRFPGQYYDAETGLHYNYFRDYDPANGRYIESDPIGLRGGWNTYAYVASSPLRWIDSFGLDGNGFSARYGNWCGRDWSGGHQGRIIPQNPSGPIDSVDECCMTHDYCYARFECPDSCPVANDAKEQKRNCDIEMVKCLDALRGKPPQTWPKPPPAGRETEAYFFCQKAKKVFSMKAASW